MLHYFVSFSVYWNFEASHICHKWLCLVQVIRILCSFSSCSRKKGASNWCIVLFIWPKYWNGNLAIRLFSSVSFNSNWAIRWKGGSAFIHIFMATSNERMFYSFLEIMWWLFSGNLCMIFDVNVHLKYLTLHFLILDMNIPSGDNFIQSYTDTLDMITMKSERIWTSQILVDIASFKVCICHLLYGLVSFTRNPCGTCYLPSWWIITYSSWSLLKGKVEEVLV